MAFTSEEFHKLLSAYNVFADYTFKITNKSPRDQWVNAAIVGCSPSNRISCNISLAREIRWRRQLHINVNKLRTTLFPHQWTYPEFVQKLGKEHNSVLLPGRVITCTCYCLINHNLYVPESDYSIRVPEWMRNLITVPGSLLPGSVTWLVIRQFKIHHVRWQIQFEKLLHPGHNALW